MNDFLKQKYPLHYFRTTSSDVCAPAKKVKSKSNEREKITIASHYNVQFMQQFFFLSAFIKSADYLVYLL